MRAVSTEARQGLLAPEGTCRYIRHPQHTGFSMTTPGVIMTWAMIPLLAPYCQLMVLYCRLAKRGEREMEAMFGSDDVDYRKHTKMFMPYGV